MFYTLQSLSITDCLSNTVKSDMCYSFVVNTMFYKAMKALKLENVDETDTSFKVLPRKL